MKLYIKEELNFKATDLGDIETVSEFLKDFTIFHTIKDDFIFIETQKVYLNEIDMNELFDGIFHMFSIEYAGMGGAGCEFSINVSLLGL